MERNKLVLTLADQRVTFEQKGNYIRRSIDCVAVASKKITVVSGIRRSGKSTLLKQFATDIHGYYYCNFEDERLLDFTFSDFQMLTEVFFESFGDHSVFFFDEIQNVAGWEKFVRRLFDEGNKIFVTGSNARLLSSELATSLTGRYLKIELFPFSFREFLSFHGVDILQMHTTRERSAIARQFQKYCAIGGFPEVVISENKDELTQLYQDVLIKDLLVRFKIRDMKAFRELAFYLISHATLPMSYNNLAKLLGFKSVTTVKNYIDFLEEAYLFFSVYRFDYSIKKQLINDRKMYCIDTGLMNAVAFAVSENRGHALENAVFLELQRRGCDTFYYRGRRECDFLVRRGTTIVETIQVTERLTHDNRQREIEGLVEAMDAHHLKKGIIVTQDQEEKISAGDKEIAVYPAWKWALGNG